MRQKFRRVLRKGYSKSKARTIKTPSKAGSNRDSSEEVQEAGNNVQLMMEASDGVQLAGEGSNDVQLMTVDY